MDSDLPVAIIDSATGAGSLLVGRTRAESDMLKGRAKQLSEAGLKAEYLCGSDLSKRESDLLCGRGLTVEYLQMVTGILHSKGRYAEFYDDPVKCFIRSDSNGGVEAVQASKTTLYSKKAIVVAAGCWTGSLMKYLFRNWGPVRSRKGHLLALQNFNSLQLNHGLMEAVPDSKAVIGPVSGLSNVYLVAGHEGGGLSMVS
ncbi:hypothetical protein TSUD_389870 [Trifolium subterraneum]|uniref:FAD-dependent oxidoreductase domain-containing protein 1 n=1 Tax=Trifolium subterraneum TaxID=3900 RepID=A0A2Z6NF53_TRISU|nr:hypothetical protein TSUD_389870 [Trifolium subterraneum]